LKSIRVKIFPCCCTKSGPPNVEVVLLPLEIAKFPVELLSYFTPKV